MLGKSRSARSVRSKAHPDRYQGEGPVTIAQAYEELSKEAFATWMRLQVEPATTLSAGREAIAAALGITSRSLNTHLAELRRVGYVRTLREYSGRVGPATLLIERRALIRASDGFVRLSRLTLGPSYAQPQDASLCQQDNGRSGNLTPSLLTLGPSYAPSPEQTHQTLASIARAASTAKTRQRAQKKRKFECESGYFAGASALLRTQSRSNIGILDQREKPLRGKKRDPSEPTEASEASGGPSPQPEQGKPALVARLASSVSRVKAMKSAEHAQARKLRELRKDIRVHKALVTGADPSKINWGDVDKHGAPVVSFDPGAPERARHIELLNRNPRDKERKRLVSKIGTEFSRIYTRYRRDAERRQRGSSTYEIPDREQKYASAAGIWCLLKGVTPRQVLEYWDSRIGNFADGSMSIVPLSFLSGPANIDKVACTIMSRRPGERLTKPQPISAPKPAGGNSYADSGGLDPMLRRRLEAAGFATQTYNDRYMLSIQHSALSLASGKRVFLAEGKMKSMVLWAAENVYAQRG